MNDLELINLLSNSDLNKHLIRKYLTKRRNGSDCIYELLTNELIKRKSFYIPKPTFLTEYYNAKIDSQFTTLSGHPRKMGLYIPVMSINSEKVYGLIQYNSANESKYRYPITSVYKKGRYISLNKENFIRAQRAGYIILVEGVFDELILSSLGYPVASTGGVEVDKLNLTLLSLFQRVIIIHDNDKAGLLLREEIIKSLQRKSFVKSISVNLPVKDISDYLVNEEKIAEFNKGMDNLINNSFAESVINFV